MEKKNVNNPKSGEVCHVREETTAEQHLIGRREQKLIEDYGETAPVAAAMAEPMPRKKKGWFGWWAAALFALVAIGVGMYFAVKDSQIEQRKVSSLAYNTGVNNAGANGLTVNGQNANVRRHVTVIQKQRIVRNGVNAGDASGATATLINTGDNMYAPMATAASIDAASNRAREVDYLYYFGNDKSAVPANAVLDEIAERAKATDADITITAHASEVGTPAYNMALSEDRAENLADYLIAHGVPSDNVHVKAAGATDQYGDNYSLNRRADILVNYAG